MAMAPKHMGFKGAAASVASKEGIPMANADKIIGAGKAKASMAAKRRNPNLMNKPGDMKGMAKKGTANNMAKNMMNSRDSDSDY